MYYDFTKTKFTTVSLIIDEYYTSVTLIWIPVNVRFMARLYMLVGQNSAFTYCSSFKNTENSTKNRYKNFDFVKT